MTATSDASSGKIKLWTAAVMCSLALGLVLGLALRAWAVQWLPPTVGVLGLIAGIITIGTSNIFQADPSKHYQVNTQRLLSCLSGLCLGAAIVTLFP